MSSLTEHAFPVMLAFVGRGMPAASGAGSGRKGRRLQRVVLPAVLAVVAAACEGGSDDGPGRDAAVEGLDRAAEEEADDVASHEEEAESDGAAGTEATCRELVDRLAGYVDDHRAGCEAADDCTVLGRVFSEFPAPACDCKWVLARPSDPWGPQSPFVVLDDAAAEIQPVVDQIERECISWERCIGGSYCCRFCDVLWVQLRPSCQAGTCSGEFQTPSTFCNTPDG